MKRLILSHIIVVLACMTTVYAMEKAENQDKSRPLKTDAQQTNSSFHTADINCLYYKNDHLFSASDDRTVKVWSESLKEIAHDSYLKLLPFDLIVFMKNYMGKFSYLDTLKCVDTLEHDNKVKALLIDGDGLLFSGDEKGKIYIWQKSEDTKNYQCIGHLSDHEGTFTGMDGRPQKYSNRINGLLKYEDKLISGSYDKTIKIWEKTDLCDPKTYTCRHTVSDFLCGLSLIGNFVVSFSSNWTVANVWEIAKNETKLTKKGLLPIKVGKYVDSSDIIFDLWGHGIQVWQKQNNNDVMSYKCIAALKLEESAMSFHFASSKMAIFTGDNEGKIRIWQKTKPEDPETFAYVTKLDNKERICALAVDESGTIFAGGDGSLKIWRPSDPSNLKTYECICVLGWDKPKVKFVASGGDFYSRDPGACLLF